MRKVFVIYLALFLSVVVAAATAAQNSNSSNSNKSSNSRKSTNKNSNSASSSNLIDINSADKQTLMGLPGVGEAYSQKIIDGRPYKMKSDLVKRGIIPQSLYNSISAKIIAHQPKP